MGKGKYATELIYLGKASSVKSLKYYLGIRV